MSGRGGEDSAVCTLRMARRPSSSGRLMRTRRSKRPGRTRACSEITRASVVHTPCTCRAHAVQMRCRCSVYAVHMLLVENLVAVGRCHDHHARLGLEPVHAREHLVERLLHLAKARARARTE